MIVKDLVLQLLEMPQHKETTVLLEGDGLISITNVTLDNGNNAVVISLEEE